jgi:hypothetical protein
VGEVQLGRGIGEAQVSRRRVESPEARRAAGVCGPNTTCEFSSQIVQEFSFVVHAPIAEIVAMETAVSRPISGDRTTNERNIL